jgi:5-(carboxyamino)imidazole ribonucleotide synthase
MITYQSQKILPPATIGILGGGQLGRMLALSGRNMGYRFVTLEPTLDSPCGQVADQQIVASYHDLSAAQQFANACDVITYEFENVDSQVTEYLMNHAYVPQGVNLLVTTQHRLREKQALEQAGAQVAPYQSVTTIDQLREAVNKLGCPSVLKTVTGGYDGKGQYVIHKAEDIPSAWDQLSRAKVDLVLEKFIDLDKEISVIVARNPSGQVQAFPVAENKHIGNILHTSIVPARVSQAVQAQATQTAICIAECLQVIGLIAVEFFLSREGHLYVNELAPRPHNSGHYTMEACKTSQFEQHLRAVCNLPLGSTELMSSVVMINILGEHVAPVLDQMANLNHWHSNHEVTAKVHLYGKHEAKEKRKMGHINLLCHEIEDALTWIDQASIWRNS